MFSLKQNLISCVCPSYRIMTQTIQTNKKRLFDQYQAYIHDIISATNILLICTYLYNLSKLNSEYQRHLKKRLIIVFSIHNPYTLEKVHYYKIMTCKYYYLLRYMNKRISKMKKESPRRWTRTTLSLDSYRFEACTPDLRSSSRQ